MTSTIVLWKHAFDPAFERLGVGTALREVAREDVVLDCVSVEGDVVGVQDGEDRLRVLLCAAAAAAARKQLCRNSASAIIDGPLCTILASVTPRPMRQLGEKELRRRHAPCRGAARSDRMVRRQDGAVGKHQSTSYVAPLFEPTRS